MPGSRGPKSDNLGAFGLAEQPPIGAIKRKDRLSKLPAASCLLAGPLLQEPDGQLEERKKAEMDSVSRTLQPS
jgi:hypothetical protein